MASGIEILDLAVVCPLVGDVERGGDRAAVRIFPALLEQVRVETLVQVVHRIVERQQNDLRYLLRQVVTCFLLFFYREGGGGGGGGGAAWAHGWRVDRVCWFICWWFVVACRCGYVSAMWSDGVARGGGSEVVARDGNCEGWRSDATRQRDRDRVRESERVREESEKRKVAVSSRSLVYGTGAVRGW